MSVNKRWKRPSSAVLNNNLADIFYNDNINDTFSRKLAAVERISKQKSLNDEPSRRSVDMSKYLHILKLLINSGDAVEISDLEELRKRSIERFMACSSNAEKIIELKNTTHAIHKIPFPANVSANWLVQYQYILNWCYFKLRFISDPEDRQTLFNNIKGKYKEMFEKLWKVPNDDKITSYLHWSQICYEYAEFVDNESLQWLIDFINCVEKESSACAPSSSPLTKKDNSKTTSNKKNNIDNKDNKSSKDERRSTQSRRFKDGIDLIRFNLYKIGSVKSIDASKKYNEKIVM